MGLLIFFIILGVLIIVHEFGHFIIAKRTGVRIEKFSVGFGPSILTKKIKNTEYCLNLIPLGGYVKLAGDNLEEYKGRPDEYLSKPPGRRAQIIFCGPLLNYILGFLFFWLIFFVGYPTLTAKVGGLIDGFGAQKAGIQVGDRITAIDRENVDTWEDLQKIIYTKQEATKVEVLFLRDNQEKTVEVYIKEKKIDDTLGKERRVGLLGITADYDEITQVKYGFGQAFILGINKTLNLTMMTYKAIWRMATRQLSLRESVTGPLGIYYITSQAASLGIKVVVHLMAILSVSLAIFNLLPLPILDGGHLLLLGIEKLRGKTLSLKTERIITQTGLILIISLAIIITYNDFLRFFGDKIAKWFIK